MTFSCSFLQNFKCIFIDILFRKILHFLSISFQTTLFSLEYLTQSIYHRKNATVLKRIQKTIPLFISYSKIYKGIIHQVRKCLFMYHLANCSRINFGNFRNSTHTKNTLNVTVSTFLLLTKKMMIHQLYPGRHIIYLAALSFYAFILGIVPDQQSMTWMLEC